MVISVITVVKVYLKRLENRTYLPSIKNWSLSFCYETCFIYIVAFSFLEYCKKDRCKVNGILKIGKYLQSQNGYSRLILNDTGNLEIWCKRKKLWTTNTNDHYVDSLIFKDDGKIYLLAKDNHSRLEIGTSLTNSTPQLMVIENNGNLVIFNECGNRHWESGTGGLCSGTPGIYFS